MRPYLSVPMVALVVVIGYENTVDTGIPPETDPVSTTSAAAALAFRRVSAGNDHSCGVTTDNRAFCWGLNDGKLGDGTTTTRLTPVPVAGGLRFSHVSVGGVHTCGVTLENRAFCWGQNADGTLGDGTVTRRLTPVPVAGGREFVQISAGTIHTCAVSRSVVGGEPEFRVFCWGWNLQGQLGDGTTTSRLTPTPVAGNLSFSQVSAGHTHTCAITADTQRAFCWGLNISGQIGDGSTATRLTPTQVATAIAFRQISAGGDHSCALSRDSARRVFCWGRNEGRLGNGTTAVRLRPVLVSGGHRFVDIAAGGFHTCGVTFVGATFLPFKRARCWGRNFQGRLGDGTTTPRLIPVLVAGGLRFKDVDAGTHTCGVTTSNLAFCWGAGNNGQRGDGTTAMQRLTPVAVADPN